MNLTVARIMRRLKVDRTLDVKQLVQEMSIPYHQVHQLMRAVAKEEGVRLENNRLYLDP